MPIVAPSTATPMTSAGLPGVVSPSGPYTTAQVTPACAAAAAAKATP